MTVMYGGGAAHFLVLSKCVDKVQIYSDKARYYTGDDMTIYVEALKKAGDKYVGVEDFEGNWTLRYLDNTLVAGYTGTGLTDATGKFNATVGVPSTHGKYILEVNSFQSMSTIEVLPFEVKVTMKDSTGQTVKSTYTSGQTAMVEVRVTKNGTTPTEGTYSFHGQISTKSGSVVHVIPSTNLSNTTYSGSYTFLINSSYFGSYLTNITVENSETMGGQAFFDVRNWGLSLSKPNKGSGFLTGYTAFPGTLVKMVARVTDLTSGNSTTADSVSVWLESSLGDTISTSTATWGAINNGYLFNITMPSGVGSYTVKFSATKGSDTLTIARILKVTDITATATPTDREGNLKEIFGASEPIYFVLKAKNGSGEVTINDMTLIEVLDEEGTSISYTKIGWGADGVNTTMEWQENTSVSLTGGAAAMIRLDNPRAGGRYTAEISLNDQDANAKARFLIDPYAVCTYPTSAETIGGSYRSKRLFSLDEAVRFKATVAENKPKAGSEVMLYYGGYNFGKCVGDEITFVKGANITILKVINQHTREEIPLSELNITSGMTDSDGEASITVVPGDGKWGEGWYQVVLGITGPDGVTTGKGWSSFEAKRFYIYGHGVDSNNNNWHKWNFKPNENITMKVVMVDAGNNYWWYSGEDSGGLSGTATVTKILYYGTRGNRIWPPLEYSYAKELPETSVSDGKGYFNLTAPEGGWDAGSYSLVLRGATEDGEEEYGRAGFEIKLWEAWASLVEVDETTQEWKYKYAITPSENASLMVRIFNTGNWWHYSGAEDLDEAPVRVGIEKIEGYSEQSSGVLSEEDYNFYSLANRSNRYLNLTKTYDYGVMKSNFIEAKKYILQVEPNSAWSTGYFNPVLNLTGANGTQQTGYGWFQVKAFYTDNMFVDESGERIYSSKGGADIYFNVSATNKSWTFWDNKDISTAVPINATITSITIRTWSEDFCYPVELQYPGDLELDTTDVNAGMVKIKINRTGGNSWAPGWYSGEIILESGGKKEKGWMWFEIKPFYVYASVLGENRYEISKNANLSVNLTIRDPEDWNWPYTPLPGNYTIVSIVDERWDEYGYAVTELTEYSPEGYFQGGNVILNITHPAGGWIGGSHNLKIKVENNDSVEGTGYAWFRAVPFRVEVVSINNKSGGWGVVIKPGENISVTFNVTDPTTGAPYNATLLDVSDWSYGSYDFNTSEVNGTGVVNVSAPAGGWSQGWHYLQFQFEEGVYKSIWFEARSFVGWVEGGSGAKDGDINLTIYVYDDWSLETPANVNVTNVTFINTDDYGWWNEPYTEANFTVSNPVAEGDAITIYPPPGNWTGKRYDVRVYVTDPGDSNTKAEFYSYFRIVEPEIWISYPYPGATLKGQEYLYAYVKNDPYGTVSSVEFYIIYPNGTAVFIATTNTSSYGTWSVKWDSASASDGTYTMKAEAKGASGNLIASALSGDFEIYNPAAGFAKFTGSFNDSGKDTTGDGLYDYLTIDIDVNVSTAAYYDVYGYLYTQDNYYLGFAENYTKQLSPGTNTIQLNFDGQKIRASKQNGPYNLKYAYLYETYFWTKLDYLENAYNTSSYDYTSFAAPNAELTGNYTNLTTLGLGGKYDNVTFGIEINVVNPGYYRLEGYVMGPDKWVLTDTVYYNTTGTHTVPLSIDGLEAYLAGYDVNYTLSKVYLYENWDTLDYDKPYYTIGPYASSDFRGPTSDNGILNVSWTYTMQPSVTRMEFGASPSIGDINAGTPELEIVTGSDEYVNIYPELNYTKASGIWRAFDSNGSLLWAKDTGTDESRTSAAIADIDGDGSLDISGGTTSGWNVEVMNASGDFIWTFPSPPRAGGYFLWHSSPAVADIANGVNLDGPELVIGNNWNGRVYAFDGNNNDSVDDGINYTANASSWYYNGDEGTDGVDWDVLWVYKTNGRIVSSPAVADINGDGQNEVVIGSGDSYVYALNGSTGEMLWRYRTMAAVHASAAIADIDGDGGVEVVIGSTDGYLYAFNGSTGEREWRKALGGSIYSSAAMGDIDGDGAIECVVGANDGKVHAISAQLYNETDPDELHDDATVEDDYTLSTFGALGGTSLMALNESAHLRYDGNADGGLNDSSADYVIYNHLHVLDDISGDVQLAYRPVLDSTYKVNGSFIEDASPGEVVKIKGTRYVLTDTDTSDETFELGPAIVKSLSDIAVGPDNAAVVTGTLKMLYNISTSGGKLYMYDGNSLLDSPVVTNKSAYPYKLTADDKSSDEFAPYDVYVINATTGPSGTAKISMVEKSQKFKVSDYEEGVLGYASVRVNNLDFPSSNVYFLSDVISMVKGDSVDVPDTYYQLKYTTSRQFDILRKKESYVSSGTKLNSTVSPGKDFLVPGAEITVTVIGSDIQIYFGSHDLHDNANTGDEFNMTTLSYNNDSKLYNISQDGFDNHLRYDGNSDGDLKDSPEDYILYSHYYVVDSSSGDIQLAFRPTLDSTYSDPSDTYIEDLNDNNTGAVIKIKGTKYVITDSDTSDLGIELGPAITKRLSNTTKDPDNAAVVTGTLKMLYSDGKLVMYDGISLLNEPNVYGKVYYKLNSTDKDSDEYSLYDVYVISADSTEAKIAMVEISQKFKLANDEEGALGYAKIKVEDSDWNTTNVMFLSDTISMVKGYKVDVPDTYYQLKYTTSKGFDILRKKVSTVLSGSTVKSTTSPGKDFMTSGSKIIMSVVGTDINIVAPLQELHDDTTPEDDYTQSSLSTTTEVTGGAGYDDGTVNALNQSAVLRFDGNSDGDLKDDPDDYDLYTHLVILDAYYGDIQFGYKLTEHATYSDGDGSIDAGEVVAIKGNNYVVTDNETLDLDIELGPAVFNGTLNATTVDPDNTTNVTGTLKMLYSNGKLYMYDGNSMLESPTITGKTYPYKLTANDKTSDEYAPYDVYVISVDSNKTMVTMVEKAQKFKVTNNEEGVLGYSMVKVADADWMINGTNDVFFLSDIMTLIRGDTIDLPDTYYDLKYTTGRKFDIKRKTVSVSQEWSYATGGPIYSSPALANRTGGYDLTIYVGSNDDYLYAINHTGGLIDRIKTAGDIRTSPSVADIDGDGKLEVAIVDWYAPDHLWVLKDTDSNVTALAQEWPMFRKDAARSGYYN